MTKVQVYFSGMLWLIFAFQIPKGPVAVLCFIVGLWHGVAIIWMVLAREMAEDEIYQRSK